MAESGPTADRVSNPSGNSDATTNSDPADDLDAIDETNSESDVQSVTFTTTGFWKGVVAGFPVAIGVAGYGVVFGVVANRAGLSVAEAAIMSATVLAGAAQLVAVGLWADPLPVVAIVTTTAVVNLRYVLMGASLRPWFRQLSPTAAYTSVFFFADENWALTMATLREGSRYGAFLLGSGVVLWALWIVSTIAGATAGDLIGDPERFGLDFVVTALFLTLAAGFWEGTESIAPWSVAGAVSIVAYTLLPGEWYILCGALAGATIEVVITDD